MYYNICTAGLRLPHPLWVVRSQDGEDLQKPNLSPGGGDSVVLHLLREASANGRLEQVDKGGHQRLVLGRLVLRGRGEGRRGEEEGRGREGGGEGRGRGGGGRGGEGRGEGAQGRGGGGEGREGKGREGRGGGGEGREGEGREGEGGGGRGRGRGVW